MRYRHMLLSILCCTLVLPPMLASGDDAPLAFSVFLPLVGNSRPKLPPAETVLIPAGTFQMGCDNRKVTCVSESLPLHPVTLGAFAIDKYEVTNARYAECVDARACDVPCSRVHYSCDHSHYGDAAYDDHPVTYIDLTDAEAFCQWDGGKRLPTEAEWEKAARGAEDTRTYPWGDQAPTCSRVNFNDQAIPANCIGDTTAVGSYPTGASPYGVMDMAGNVLEWTSDHFGDPSENKRIAKGGHWNSYPSGLQVSSRDDLIVGWPADVIGLRCVRSP